VTAKVDPQELKVLTSLRRLFARSARQRREPGVPHDPFFNDPEAVEDDYRRLSRVG
jgi:hypothetical protein